MISMTSFAFKVSVPDESQAISGCGADPGAGRTDAKRNSRILVKTKKYINLIERNLRLMRLGKYLSSLTKPELEELKNVCNFVDEDLVIIDCLIREKSYEEISSYIKCSTATVGRKISAIKEKVEGSELDMKNKVPIWEKANLTIEEAAEYSNIGICKLNEISKDPKCTFVLYVGRKKLIKRKEFEKFLNNTLEL